MPVGHALALIAGAALPLAFAPVGWAWLAIISPALLFLLVAIAPERRALWSAYLFGLGYFGVGVSWVYISIGRYGSGPAVAAVATSLFVALLALFPWLAVYVARKVRPRMDAIGLWLALPAAWVVSEWLRTWILTGFPWLLLGYSQTDTWLANIAPVFGVLGVSFVVASLAGGLAWGCLHLSIGRVAITTAVVGAVLLGTSLIDWRWTSTSGESLSVALIQGNIAQDKKWSSEYRALTLERYRALTEKHWGVDLIVWPETAVPVWYSEAGDFLTNLEATSEDAGSGLILGVPVRDAQGNAYNAAVSLGDEPDSFYFKRHLVPFGEYVPLRGLIGPMLDILGAPMSDFTAGKHAQLLTAAATPVGAFICYEAAFGAEVADLLPEAELLVNISNDAWFGDSLAPHQHLQMARMRAIETGRDLLRATNTGITAVIDHEGRVLKRAPQFEVAALAAEVMPRTGATPYVRWRDSPVLGISIGLLLATGLARTREASRRSWAS